MLYYFSAGVFDLIILAFVCIYASASRFTDSMVGICLASLFLNFYGWVIYEQYMEPTSYNIAFHFLYIFTAYILLERDWKNDNCYIDWMALFRLPSRKFSRPCNSLHKEAKF